MSMDIINEEDNFLELLGDEEEEIAHSDGLFEMNISNFSAGPSTESDSGKTDDDSSVSVHNEVPESIGKFTLHILASIKLKKRIMP